MIEKLLEDRIGLSFDSLGRGNVESALAKHMAKSGAADEKAYFDLLSNSEALFDDLCRSLLIPETWFFRYSGSFSCLSQFAKDYFVPSGRRMNVLSLPCSTGEEPYSIAMVLLDSGLAGPNMHIDALDASGAALESARRATYGHNSFRGGMPEQMHSFFNSAHGKNEVVKEVRNLVAFRKKSIFDKNFCPSGDPSLRYDAIFCRNMLIYFSPLKQAEALSIISGMLSDNGILFLGHAETGIIDANILASTRYPSSFSFKKVGAADKRIAQPEPESRKDVAAAPKKTHAKPAIREVVVPARRNPSAKPAATKPQPASKEDGLLKEASAMADLGRLEDAESLCLKYLEGNKLNPSAYYVLGTIGLSEGRLDEAEKAFNRAIYLDPGHYEALVQLALIKEKRGERTHAGRMRKRAERTMAAAGR